ncbi:MAG: hypothetical protein JWO19_1225 [Bryobacterales bacterium]|jgi:hypothetical protein|nr:hypothetical protein [Bryobacterales bacterium]
MSLKAIYARAETELLVLCGRKTFGSREASLVDRTLERRLDWTFILNEGDRHCVLPLLHANLASSGYLQRVPSDARRALQAAVRRIAGHNLALTGELIRILNVLAEEGIPAIPFKGPMVALAAYGDYSQRCFADLDILVDQVTLVRAREVIARSGYRPALALTPHEERAFLKNECAVQLRDKSRGFVVELHWRFSERNASVDLPLEDFRRRCGTILLAGVKVQSLALEDLLLYLCVHGAKHCWERLEWISCVAEIVARHPQLDWTAVKARAKAYRIERLVHLGLNLAQLLFCVSVPDNVRARLETDHAVLSLSNSVLTWLFAERAVPHYHQRAARYLFMLKTRERYADKLRIIWFSAIKPPHPDAEEWINLPPQLSFLHRIFRPVRLLSQYGAVAWRHYCGGRE